MLFPMLQLKKNNKIFDELVTLFKENTAIPGDEEFPRVKPNLDNWAIKFDSNYYSLLMIREI